MSCDYISRLKDKLKHLHNTPRDGNVVGQGQGVYYSSSLLGNKNLSPSPSPQEDFQGREIFGPNQSLTNYYTPNMVKFN